MPQTRTPQEMRSDLSEWCRDREEWLLEISTGWLSTTEEVELYINNLLTPGFAVDELGMVIIARMYKLRLAVLFHKTCWNTLANDSLDVNLYVACTSRYKFSLTLKVEKPVAKRKVKEQVQPELPATLGVIKREPDCQPQSKYVRKELHVTLDDISHLIRKAQVLKKKRKAAQRRRDSFQAKLITIRRKNDRWRRSCLVKRHYFQGKYKGKFVQHPSSRKSDSVAREKVIGTVTFKQQQQHPK